MFCNDNYALLDITFKSQLTSESCLKMKLGHTCRQLMAEEKKNKPQLYCKKNKIRISSFYFWFLLNLTCSRVNCTLVSN